MIKRNQFLWSTSNFSDCKDIVQVKLEIFLKEYVLSLIPDTDADSSDDNDT